MAANCAQRSWGRTLKRIRSRESEDRCQLQDFSSSPASTASWRIRRVTGTVTKMPTLGRCSEKQSAAVATKQVLLLVAKSGQKKNGNCSFELHGFTDKDDMEMEHSDDGDEESPLENMDSELNLSDREEAKSSDLDSNLGWGCIQDVDFEESDDEHEVKIHTDPSDSEQSLVSYDYHHHLADEDDLDSPYSASPLEADGGSISNDLYFGQHSN